MGIVANSIACIVLAAGRSERYGKADKLAAHLDGKPLLHHVLATLGGFDFTRKIVVCRPDSLDVSGRGFERVDVAAVEQSASLRAGIVALDDHPCDGILVALGDMPAVTGAHIDRLLACFDPGDDRCVVASTKGDASMPPAVFARGMADELARLTGDQGARPLLRKAVRVVVAEDELIDVDTLADLERLSKRSEMARPTSQRSP